MYLGLDISEKPKSESVLKPKGKRFILRYDIILTTIDIIDT